MKSVGQPFPIRIFICTENSDAFDDSAEIVTLICRLYPERIYDIISVFGGSQYDSIKITVCSCKANILRSKILFYSVGELSFRYFSRPFTGFSPELCAVDGFTIDFEPFSDVKQNIPVLIGDCSVCFRTDIQQQTAILLTISTKSQIISSA